MATKPTKTKIKSGEIPATGERDQLPSAPQNKKSDKSIPPLTRASKGDTRRATSGISMTPTMRDTLNRLRDIEVDPQWDDPGYDDQRDGEVAVRGPNDLPVTVDNILDLLNNAISVPGMQNPKWHRVSNLPGNVERVIRYLGKQLFSQFTSTDTGDIVMVGNFMNQGAPNTRAEINAVAGWLKKHGVKGVDGTIDFSQFRPGYVAEYQMYDKDGMRFMLVRDVIDGTVIGDYVYTWPEQDSR